MLGFILGFMICFGIRGVMRMIIKDESTADEIAFVVILAVFLTVLVFAYILSL